MYPVAQPFSAQVLSSYDNVRRYLSGQSSIGFLKNESATLPPLINGHRWSRIYPITRPLLRICIVFLVKIIHCLEQRNAQSMANAAARLKDKITLRYIDQSLSYGSKSPERGKPHLLISSKNDPAPGTDDIDKHPSIPYNAIPDDRVKQCTFKDPVSFHDDKGYCKGAAFWFLYLYLQTLPLFFNDPKQHVISLGKLFVLGVPKEAILLQSLFVNQGKLLNVRIGIQTLSWHIQPAETIIHDNTGYFNKATAKSKMDNLLPGAYYVGFPLHACAYIKIHSSLGFFFDPNSGVYEINTPSQGEQLLSFFHSGYLKPGGKTEFFPFQNRV